jgi:hypothetical protein
VAKIVDKNKVSNVDIYGTEIVLLDKWVAGRQKPEKIGFAFTKKYLLFVDHNFCFVFQSPMG